MLLLSLKGIKDCCLVRYKQWVPEGKPLKARQSFEKSWADKNRFEALAENKPTQVPAQDQSALTATLTSTMCLRLLTK